MVQGLNPGRGKRFFSKISRLALASTKFLFYGNHGSFPGVKQPRCEVNNSPSSSAEVKNEGSCTSASPIYLHGMDRENFTPYS
jgi:hypothetical protein